MGNICCKDTNSELDENEDRTRILNNEDNDCENDYLTSNNNHHQDVLSYGSFGNNGNQTNGDNNAKTIEQSALDKIYQKMASNVIDVAPGESMVIQQAEFIERQKAYQAKLNQIKTPLPLRAATTNRVSSTTSSKQLTDHNSHQFDQYHISNNSPTTNSIMNTTTNHLLTNGHNSNATSNIAGNVITNHNLSPHQQKAHQSQDKRRVEYEPILAEDLQLINEISLKSIEAIENLKISSAEQVVTQFKP